MGIDWPADFETQYQTHLKRLKLAGFRPKTIEAYSQGVRRAGKYFQYQINALNEAQLTEYFAQFLSKHFWGSLKHDLYGLKFYYDKVLHQDWPAPNLVRAPHSERLPDIVTVEQMQQIITSTKVLSYRVFFCTFSMVSSDALHNRNLCAWWGRVAKCIYRLCSKYPKCRATYKL